MPSHAGESLPDDVLILEMQNGTKVAVPRSLNVTTTYVLLEQERWFEKEVQFLDAWLKPDMTVIDVGANVGVYTLPMAKRVGPDGRVFAYEPGTAQRALLERGIAVNALDNVVVSASAVADRDGEGVLRPDASSEGDALSSDGQGERVPLTSLDQEDARNHWSHIDFVKVDAEGAEERILAGARGFLAKHQPMVMLEIKHGANVNAGLADAVRGHGFALYRSLPGAPLLVRVKDGEVLDPYELNLFAVSPQRAAELAAADVLVDAPANWSPSPAARTFARECLAASAFAKSIPVCLNFDGQEESYLDAIAAYADWRFGKGRPAERYGALLYACRALTAYAAKRASPSTLAMLGRAMWDVGQRARTVEALVALLQRLSAGVRDLTEPFWPACPRFESIDPGAQVLDWFATSALEQLEIASKHSSAFAKPSVDLEGMRVSPFYSCEMERRRVLVRARAGNTVDASKALAQRSPDNLNAEVWSGGRVPNTRPAV